MRAPRLIAPLIEFSRELFKRPKPRPPEVRVFDHRDRGPNRLLSEEAKKAGVTIPKYLGERRSRPGPTRL
jgi:hypothetical protein